MSRKIEKHLFLGNGWTDFDGEKICYGSQWRGYFEKIMGHFRQEGKVKKKFQNFQNFFLMGNS